MEEVQNEKLKLSKERCKIVLRIITSQVKNQDYLK